MDLGLRGRKALVCASSKGLGKGCALSLAREGADVVINGRTPETLEAAAEEVRKAASGEVKVVCCDVTTEEGRRRLLEACPQPDILVNNAGGPPPGNFRDWEREDWIAALDANMLTAIELIKATVEGMIDRRFGRIVNITSSAVKAPISILGLSNGARAGLTGFVAGLAREIASEGVTVNNMLPGRFDTERMRNGVRYSARQAGEPFETLYEAGKRSIPAGRYGDPAEFGELCAYLCSVQAGYITGQNILIDGGAYPGTL
ncbi:MAG: SDR family oxidoreductase [Gammaproteobacteria bacterium]|nr:SDR family oxidoreductase [Gammaproteobacteria bacterium]NIR83629.1 SDR family oxidoreductase [Gammaproteobacteria bacterium]NIR91602.1 SDR family oxidoreductase [Gammaproteobacteria bacterium]NIU04791.1 SDR family oxidoreductase [Gammaproteobacteria bacterium]NIV53141.1 SDR family oxidoreductase [Gammaproteobacteria bacterium]